MTEVWNSFAVPTSILSIQTKWYNLDFDSNPIIDQIYNDNLPTNLNLENKFTMYNNTDSNSITKKIHNAKSLTLIRAQW